MKYLVMGFVVLNLVSGMQLCEGKESERAKSSLEDHAQQSQQKLQEFRKDTNNEYASPYTVRGMAKFLAKHIQEDHQRVFEALIESQAQIKDLQQRLAKLENKK